MRFFLCENDAIFTEDQLRKDFDLHKADLTEFDTFEEFLEMCQSYNNGALMEIPSADMRKVHVTEMETTDDGVTTDYYDDYIFGVRGIVSNPNAIITDGTISITLLDRCVVEQKGRSTFHRPSRWTWKKGEGVRWQH